MTKWQKAAKRPLAALLAWVSIVSLSSLVSSFCQPNTGYTTVAAVVVPVVVQVRVSRHAHQVRHGYGHTSHPPHLVPVPLLTWSRYPPHLVPVPLVLGQIHWF